MGWMVAAGEKGLGYTEKALLLGCRPNQSAKMISTY